MSNTMIMRALKVDQPASSIEKLRVDIAEQVIPVPGPKECLVKLVASGVNPSDGLALMGYFPDAVWPRVPGRDFSGIVVDGPSNFIGKPVWGSGGSAGIECDGTQQEYFCLPSAALALAPSQFNLVELGAQPLPFLTAYYSLVQRANIQENEIILIVGALGQVGRAAMSIAKWKKCETIALVRGQDELKKAHKLGWLAVDSEMPDLESEILSVSNGRKISVILNSIGNLAWQNFMRVLSEFGRIVTISAREHQRDASINLFDLYRSNQTVYGVNTVSYSFEENAKILARLSQAFSEDNLIPLPIDTQKIFNFSQASEAYQSVLTGSNSRIVISPEANL